MLFLLLLLLLLFRSKTFPKNDAQTQKRANVQDNSDFTKQSLSSIPSIKVRGHFGHVFVKPSALRTLNFLLLFTAQKVTFPRKFPLKCFFFFFFALKWLKKRCLNFGSFDFKVFNLSKQFSQVAVCLESQKSSNISVKYSQNFQQGLKVFGQFRTVFGSLGKCS